MLRDGGSRGEDIGFVECHQAWVFHRAEIVFRHEGLIVLTPGISDLELIMKPCQALFCSLKQWCRIDVVHKGVARENAKINRLRARRAVTGPSVFKYRIRSCEERRQISRDGFCGGELNTNDPVIQ